MQFRNPDKTKQNLLFLLPVFLVVPMIFLAGFEAYRYFSGAEESPFWMGLWSVATLYLMVRSYFAVRKVMVFGDEADEE